MARKPGWRLTFEPGADGPGPREWFAGQRQRGMWAAAFDTRLEGPAVLTERASKGIARLLHEHEFTIMVRPESFLVTSDNHLRIGEPERARGWGRALAGKMAAATASSS
jgi:hypothetical protein